MRSSSAHTPCSIPLAALLVVILGTAGKLVIWLPAVEAIERRGQRFSRMQSDTAMLSFPHPHCIRARYHCVCGAAHRCTFREEKQRRASDDGETTAWASSIRRAVASHGVAVSVSVCTR